MTLQACMHLESYEHNLTNVQVLYSLEAACIIIIIVVVQIRVYTQHTDMR